MATLAGLRPHFFAPQAYGLLPLGVLNRKSRATPEGVRKCARRRRKVSFFDPFVLLGLSGFGTFFLAWAAANGGVTNGGLRGVWPPFPEIGRNRPFLPFFCLFRPFPEGAKSTWEIQKTEEKGLFPHISTDFLKPPSLKPPFAALQLAARFGISGAVCFGHFLSSQFSHFCAHFSPVATGGCCLGSSEYRHF